MHTSAGSLPAGKSGSTSSGDASRLVSLSDGSLSTGNDNGGADEDTPTIVAMATVSADGTGVAKLAAAVSTTGKALKGELCSVGAKRDAKATGKLGAGGGGGLGEPARNQHAREFSKSKNTYSYFQ